MKQLKAHILFVALFVIGHFAVVANAQFVSELGNWRDRDDSTTPNNVFVLHPMAEPAPALQYRLLPKFMDLRPGNAAVYYGKVMAEQSRFFGDYELHEKLYDLIDAPLDQVRESEMAANAIPEASYQQLRMAALCDSCDWQIPVRYEQFYLILLPELQQTRTFARLLSVRARYQIAHGKFDDAIETLQTGYALARNDATGPTYVHLLVAISVKTLMDQQLETLIQQPGAPNMYWAIASMPDPFLSSRSGTEAELNAIELNFPNIRDLSITNLPDHSSEFWRNQLMELLKLETLVDYANWESPRTKMDSEQLAAFITMEHFSRARRQLVESGIYLEMVDSLSPSQVVLLQGVRELQHYNDELTKWMYLPYPMAIDGIVRSEGSLETEAPNQVLGLAGLIAPATRQIVEARTRAQRQFAVLQLVEAVRIYAAEHDGKLPEKLEDITSAPVPYDPATGKPFVCRLDGDHLNVSGPDLRPGPLDIRLKIAN